MPSAGTRVSVVVPATNRPPTLDRCLAAIEASSEPADEIVVVSDGVAGRGPAAARNEGLRRAHGDIVVFVDADVLVRPDAVERLKAHFDGRERDELVAVFGSYDDAVGGGDIVSGFRNLLHHTVHHRHPGPAETFWAGLGAVRRDVALDVGGFDAARYPLPSIEDIEFGTRLSRVGTILLDPAIQGTHLKRWTVGSMLVTDFARRGVPWVELIAERRDTPSALNLGLRERASALAAIGATVSAAGRRPRLAATLVGAQVVLNADLYRVVGRRLGAPGLLATPALHTLHQLVATAAVPVGLARHLVRARAGRPQASRPAESAT